MLIDKNYAPLRSYEMHRGVFGSPVSPRPLNFYQVEIKIKSEIHSPVEWLSVHQESSQDLFLLNSGERYALLNDLAIISKAVRGSLLLLPRNALRSLEV